jgi:hypothetical protein
MLSAIGCWPKIQPLSSFLCDNDNHNKTTATKSLACLERAIQHRRSSLKEEGGGGEEEEEEES